MGQERRGKVQLFAGAAEEPAQLAGSSRAAVGPTPHLECLQGYQRREVAVQ